MSNVWSKPIRHSFVFMRLLLIGAWLFRCFKINEYQILKSSSMLGSSATNVFRSLVKSEMNAFSSKSLKLLFLLFMVVFLVNQSRTKGEGWSTTN